MKKAKEESKNLPAFTNNGNGLEGSFRTETPSVIATPNEQSVLMSQFSVGGDCSIQTYQIKDKRKSQKKSKKNIQAKKGDITIGKDGEMSFRNIDGRERGVHAESFPEEEARALQRA